MQPSQGWRRGFESLRPLFYYFWINICTGREPQNEVLSGFERLVSRVRRTFLWSVRLVHEKKIRRHVLCEQVKKATCEQSAKEFSLECTTSTRKEKPQTRLMRTSQERDFNYLYKYFEIACDIVWGLYFLPTAW